jgi:hypothetical protein
MSYRLAALFLTLVPVLGAQDPRCANRTAAGQLTCVINQPNVRQHETVYSSVVFAPGDVVRVHADGCVQTGGLGATWKRYVNPSGPNSGLNYHGLVRIPGGSKASALVPIVSVIDQLIKVNGDGIPLNDLVLHLGYTDDDYSDNGYDGHDDGTDGQCTNRPGLYGGPAIVTVTIFRGVPPTGGNSNFSFDVISGQLDPNGLPLNPQWSWQRMPGNAGKMPDTSICHQFTADETKAGIPIPGTHVPSFADCTDQADLTSVDLPIEINAQICNWGGLHDVFDATFAGHVNWFPVTMEGHAYWGDHGTDDDYTFGYISDSSGLTNPLSINGRPGLHVEFDSDETMDNFQSQEWGSLKSAVNQGDNGKALAEQLFDGHTILTGMFGLDGEHDFKAELHPLYALATLRDNYENDPGDEVWLMFVRNLGDEGFCSSRLWDAGFTDYTFRLPWHAGMTSVQVNWSKTQFKGTDGTSGPTVSALPPSGTDPGGVFVSFHLGPSSSAPLMDGALHLAWSGQVNPPVVLRSAVTARAGSGVFRRPVLNVQPPDEIEERINEAIRKLPASARSQVEEARRSAVSARVLRTLPSGGPVRMLETAPAAPRLAVVRRHAINAGPATAKAAREAAVMKVLCAATHNAPDGLPPAACRK